MISNFTFKQQFMPSILSIKKTLLFTFILSASIPCCNAQAFITRWKTDNPGTTPTQIQIPGVGNYQINWVDITNASNNGTAVGDGTTLVTFPSAGTYEVSITGGLTAMHFDGGSDREKILSIEQWGNIQWLTMESAFERCENLVINATDAPDLSRVTDMSEMFYFAASLNQNINHWDVSHVTDMSYMFSQAATFNQPLNNWNVSNVTTMYYMFYQAEKFNQPLNNWNVGNVTNMSGTFYFTELFNQNINAWDVSNVTTMNHMFAGAKAFNQPLNSWNVSNVTDMGSMFGNCALFNQPLNNWDVSAVTDMSGMFSGASYFDQNIGMWDVSNVTNMRGMFFIDIYFNQDISNWDVSNVTNMAYMFDYTYYFDQPIGKWDVSNVTTMESMFNMAYAFNHPLKDWDVSSVTSMETMFRNSVFNQPVGNWDVSNVNTMRGMFYQDSYFNQNLDNWNTSNVTLMGWMFYEATKFNQNLSNWDITNVTDLEIMLNRTALSNSNYDALLESWSNQNVKTGLELGALDLKYCTATDARNVLINDKGWTIVGDAFECATTPTSTVNAQSQNNLITCYPVPLNKTLNESLTIKGFANDAVTISINDIGGRVVYTENLSASGGSYIITYDKLSNLSSGTYIVSIISEKTTANQLLIIQ